MRGLLEVFSKARTMAHGVVGEEKSYSVFHTYGEPEKWLSTTSYSSFTTQGINIMVSIL